MANISIGASGLIGTVSLRPIRLAPQPHWNTATTTPYAAAMLITLSTAALSGTSTDRNTTISTRNDSPITALTNQQHAARQPLGDVDLEGGRAGDHGLDVVPTCCGGQDLVRSRCTRVPVAASWGDVVGVTTMTARSPARAERRSG